VSWKDEAVESAQSYLDMSSYSKQGLIEQLPSSAGDGYTQAQSEYAANKVY
jgi:Host cell surface-exposed lipoprotein